MTGRPRAASHPDFHRRSRNFTGSTGRWTRTGRRLSPPARSFTDPGARLHCYKPVCHTRYSVASCVSSRRPRAELVDDPVLGDQALTVTRAELGADLAYVHSHGAAAPRHRPPWLAHGAVPDPSDQFGPGEYGGRVRSEER